MSRWWLVALAGVAGMLVWVMATWPLPAEVPEDDAPESEPAALAADPPPQLPAAEPAPAVPSPGEPELEPDPAPEPTAAAEPPPSDTPAEPESFFTRENGPLAEYKALFEQEPRDSAASDAEQLVRGAFNPKDSPQPVFRSVLCRETICRIETRFTAENMGGYVAAMTRMVHEKFDPKLASERTAQTEAGEVSVTVYAKRPPRAD